MASRDQSGANSIKLYLYSLSPQGSTRDGKPIAIVKGMGWPEFLYKVRNRNPFVTQYQRLKSLWTFLVVIGSKFAIAFRNPYN